jgi:hypothetical protein
MGRILQKLTLGSATEVAQIFWLLYSTVKVLHFFRQKMGYWRFFFTKPSDHPDEANLFNINYPDMVSCEHI